jgi:cardiolipin synthase A/B
MTAAPDDVPPQTTDPWWARVQRPVFTGGHSVRLLQGGDELFPAVCQAISQAQHQVWLATYIFHNDAVSLHLLDTLQAAAKRGVKVCVVVDGFGSSATLAELQKRLHQPAAPDAKPDASGVALAVFRPMHRWWSWLQPAHLRRLHQKLCVVDSRVAFVGGINIMDDRFDLRHGPSALPRLDFAVRVEGSIAVQIEQAVRAVWTRASLGQDFSEELRTLARVKQPLARLKRLLKQLRMPQGVGLQRHAGTLAPVQAAFVLRDNLRQRRTIERSYISALRHARQQVDLMSPYFYPATAFRRALCAAARRGVQVRLLLQGKLEFPMAGLAARVLYDELLSSGVQVFEYTPAFLHAKVAVVDEHWATVGSSNIDPLSLLLNLEANVIVRDAAFSRELRTRFEQALRESSDVRNTHPARRGLLLTLMRRLVAWCAHIYLRLAGADDKY